jgi:hypothetical protein
MMLSPRTPSHERKHPNQSFILGEIGKMYSLQKMGIIICSLSFSTFFFITPFFTIRITPCTDFSKINFRGGFRGEFIMYSPVIGDIN